MAKKKKAAGKKKVAGKKTAAKKKKTAAKARKYGRTSAETCIAGTHTGAH